MIALAELLGGAKLEEQSEEVRANLAVLLHRVNKVRAAYAKPMTVTSGLRTWAQHLQIYKKKLGDAYAESKVPKASKHLIGAAVDISDPKRLLQKWCIDNVKTLEDAGLWCEAFEDTPTWVHFQCQPPKSGKRFFRA